MFEGKASVTANMCMGPSAFLLLMRAPAVAREAEPGQFVLLRVSTTYDPLLRRPFSICR
ncbi:MAG TPA: dihydroorotate dehydrogenase electron transfer subunit, partial [Firmicutes bacterium]|nr:dihydroorotate dehydrogenase electron transfer subunit [Bacillota bacterium]